MSTLTAKTRSTRLMAVVLAGALVTASLGQSAQRDPNQLDQDKPIVGIRLTPRLLSNLLDKAADRLAKDYGFDEFQREQMRQVLQERVPRFLAEHQEDLQRLVNEWLEAASAETPPDPEFAADWAARALPVVEEFRTLIDDVSGDMREFLTDEQEILLDGYLAAINTVTDQVDRRLHRFKEGGFDPKIDWPGNRNARRLNRQNARELRSKAEAARQRAMQAAAGGASAPAVAKSAARGSQAKPAQADDEWTRYVEAFIKRYQLNDQQSQRARQFLKQAVTQRDRHLQLHSADMERITRLYDRAKTPEQFKTAEAAYNRVVKLPLERMFERLKDKLDTLPTRAQRKAAALRQQTARPTDAKPKPTPARPTRGKEPAGGAK